MQSYLTLLNDIMLQGEKHQDRTGVGTTSLFGYQWSHDMREGFPLLTTKKVPLRWVFEELMWMLRGDNDETNLRAKGVDIWKEWATAEQCAKFGREEGDLGHIYGPLWRNFLKIRAEHSSINQPSTFGNDQIATLLHDIEHNPNSRRLIVTGWHPVEQRRVALPPCHTLWQVKVHDEKELSLHLYARSIDAFLGLPFNMAQYGLLLHILCGLTKHEPRDLIISFGDLHIYDNHHDAVKEQWGREPYPLPQVSLNIEGKRLDEIVWSDVSLTGYKHHPKISAEVAI